MKLSKCLRLLAAIVIVTLLPKSDAVKRKIQFKQIYSSALPVNSVRQPTISRPPSPTNPNPGSSGVTEARLVTPKESFRLPGTSGTHKSVEHRKHDDFPALNGNHARKVDQYTRLSPPPQRESPLPPQIESILSKNSFARLPGARKSSDHVNQPKQPEEFPPLGGSSDRLNANRNPALPGSSSHAETFNKKSLESPEAQRKFSLHDYPALPDSSHSQNPSSRPSLESLANSQSKSSLNQIPALPGSSNHGEALTKKSLESPEAHRKFSFQDYPALSGSHHSKNPRSHPSLESLSSQSKSSLNQIPALPGSSNHSEALTKKSLESPEAHRKFSPQDFPALPVSSNSKNPSSHPSLESLANSQNKLSLDQFPPLRDRGSSFHIPKNSPDGLNPSTNSLRKMSLDEFPALGASRSISKSNSLTLRNTQSSTNLQGFVREGSVDSTRSLRFPSDLNSPLNSPFYQNKNFFGSSSSSLTSTSGLGASYHSATSGSFSSLSTGRNSPGMGRGRKFSDASLVPHTPVAVSDMTCKDDTSPAEQCFNYFTFSLFWPPALGYEYQTKNKPVNDNINTLKWSIHALWPSSHSGIVPENCHKRTSVTFNQYRFEREKGLRASLENKWVTICPYKWTGSSAVSFWDREFSKHGACAARSLLIGSDVGYFKMANSLFDNVGITNVLLNIGFEVGTQMSYGDLVEKVNEKLGKRARIEFISDKINNNKHYLKEIKVCYDLQFHRINCPGTGLISTDVRSKEITYLDHVPTLQSTISI